MRRSGNESSTALLAITSSALLLPAYQQAKAQTQPDVTEMGLRYSNYEEDDISSSKAFGGRSERMEVDVVQFHMLAPVADNWSFALDVGWEDMSGASPWFVGQSAEGDPKVAALVEMMTALQDEAEGWLRVVELWRFFEAEPEGNTIHIFRPGEDAPAVSLSFPRQPKADGLCLADFVLPPAEGRRDSVALFVVGAGDGVRDRATADRNTGEYLRSHAIQALAVETAEAAAERLHHRLREAWGFPDPPEMTMNDRFRAAYRGKRYSPGAVSSSNAVA